MKLLKASDNVGQFLDGGGQYVTIDKISKDDLLRLANLVLKEDAVEMDEFDENKIKNQSHQIIYKSVVLKLTDLRKRRQQFIDDSARLFLDDYQKYRDAAIEHRVTKE